MKWPKLLLLPYLHFSQILELYRYILADVLKINSLNWDGEIHAFLKQIVSFSLIACS